MKLLLLSFFAPAFLFSQQQRIAIIGGGMAGVSALHKLQEYDADAKITLFEKESVLGGNAQTVEVKNIRGEACLVDVGPQYFADDAWDDYLQFIEKTIGKQAISHESVGASLLIQRNESKKPFLITPLNGKLRGEKIGHLLKIKKFNDCAYRLYTNADQHAGLTIEKWVESLDFTAEYKKQVIYPFLAASIGVNIQEIGKMSAPDIVKLFAFRKTKLNNEFHIMKEGMGGIIQKIAASIHNQNVEILTSSPVYKVERKGEKYLVTFKNGAEEITREFEFIVMAVHADIAAKILASDPQFESIRQTLSGFHYFEVRIVLHSDTSYTNPEKPAFMSIMTNASDEVVSSTMNLGLISNCLEGVYKSWISAEEANKIRKKSLLLYETVFYHPLITVEFIEHLNVLHRQIDNFAADFCIIGGWSEGLETQNSAVLSGQRALEVYKKFKAVKQD